MFHFDKHATSEKILDSLRHVNIMARQNVLNINTTSVTNGRGFMVACPCKFNELDAYGYQSWWPISVADKMKDEVTQSFILECLYIGDINGAFYARGTKFILRALREFGFIH